MDNTGNAYVSYSIQKLKEYLLGVIANLGTSGDGREVQIQATETYIQWKYDTDVSWTNLVALADLKGDTGETGATGATGAQGPAGPAGADAVISNTTITNNLYATYGDISELTVDRLLTLNKVEKYWAGDTDEVNYIKVQDQTYRAVTGTTDGSTTQLTDRDGNLLYYKGPVTAGTYKTVGMSAAPTAYPVMVYDYDELVKMTIGHVFDADSGYMVPQIIMGAGSGTGDNGKFFITKTATGLSMTYHTSGGEDTTLTFGDYVDAKHRRLKSAAIDKTLGEITVLMEGQTAGDEEVIEFTETATSMTFTWPDAFVCTVSIS